VDYILIELNLVIAFFVILIYLHVGFVLQSIYVHRFLTHRSVSFTPKTEKIIKFLCWIFSELPNKYQIAAHRKHHKYSDKEEDPHSPHHINFKHFWIIDPSKKFILFLLSFFILKKEYENKDLKKYILKDEKYENSFMYKYSFGRHVFVIINYLLFGIAGIILSIVYYFLIIFLGRWFMGWIHIFGYTNHAINNHSKNLIPIGIFFGGEELHNNHHAKPNRCNLSTEEHEFDVGYFYLRLLEKMKLCKIVN